MRVDPGETITGLRKQVGQFRWISDHRLCFLSTVWDNSAFTGVSAVDCDGKNWVALTGSDSDPLAQYPLHAKDILYSFDDKAQSILMLDFGYRGDHAAPFPDVIRVNTLTKASRIEVKNPGNVLYWVPDRRGTVRLGVTADNARTGMLFREKEDSPWQKLPAFPKEKGRVVPLGFDASGQRVIVMADNETKRRAVYYCDLKTGLLDDVIASHPEFDIIPESAAPGVDGTSLAGPMISELTQDVVGIRFVTEGPRQLWFDSSLDAVQTAVDRQLPGTVNLIVSRTRNEQRFLLLAFSEKDPGTYYLADLKGPNLTLQRLGAVLLNFPTQEMATMYPVKYKARDGERIHGYVTLPRNGPQKGLPLVVMPHGGPWVRDIWQYDPFVQFLASRGYAVLQMNFRGSPGYGREFLDKGQREIGLAMQNDVEDGTRWAIAQGLADPQRIAIMGGSYGGFATLFALGHNPELYRCGISLCGVTDWIAISRERKGEDYKLAYQHFQEWIGDPKHNAEFLASISPVNFAEQITAPVFLVQGKLDRIVPPKQATRMADELAKAGRPAKTLTFSDEGHGFSKPENRAKLFAEIETFLAQHLKPAALAQTDSQRP